MFLCFFGLGVLAFEISERYIKRLVPEPNANRAETARSTSTSPTIGELDSFEDTCLFLGTPSARTDHFSFELTVMLIAATPILRVRSKICRRDQTCSLTQGSIWGSLPLISTT